MASNGWMDIATCPRAERREDARRIIVWHVFQGAMVYSTLNAHQNRFNVYWREPPDTWIDPHDWMPTVKDADPQNCILIIDNHGELRVRGWQQVETPDDVRAWAPRPEPPEDYQKLRQAAF